MTVCCEMEPAHEPGRPKEAVLPLRFLLDFLGFLHAHRARIEVLTYADLAWDDTCETDWDDNSNYASEWQRWKAQISSGERDPSKIYVVLQHDVDDVPERTEIVLRAEQSFGIRSNVMIFNRRINRLLMQSSGVVEIKDYPINDDYYRELEQQGWVIGYHCNAYERAGFNPARAEEIFAEDIRELRKRFNIRYFCPHGGVRDGEGRSNSALEIPTDLRSSLRWVLNRKTVRFDAFYSDGAINSPRRNAAERDLRDFVRAWQPGRRYRVLVHPQYYGNEYRRTETFDNVEWYERIVAGYQAEPPRSAWAGFTCAKNGAVMVNDDTGIIARFTDDIVLPGRPIFIGGDGRSGTTLLNVVLDSHPDLAVGPELHFGGPVDLGPYILRCIELIEHKDPRTIGKALNDNTDIKPGVQFVRRVQRAGFEITDLADLVREAMRLTSSRLESFGERSVLIDLLGRLACTNAGACRWGFKIMREIRRVRKFYDVWPGAQVLHIIRDGRDVAASQMLEHASWGYGDIERAARGWVSVIDEARASAAGAAYFEVRYEDLTGQPETILRGVLEFLGVPWEPAVLRHDQLEHAFFDSHVKHPSREATRQPINDSAVGRYRRDLNPAQIAAFEAIAGDKLRELGYPLS